LDYPLVLVEWIDAAGNQNEDWGSQGGALLPFLNSTSGYALAATAGWIRIASTRLEDGGDHQIGWRNRHVFPREMVKKVTLLETGATWEWPKEA
jgi:hypothetical protein